MITKIKVNQIPIIIIVLTFSFVSCEKTCDIENIDKTFLLPLKVGNVWNYEATYYDSSKNVLYKDFKNITITGDTIINNQLWYNIDFGGYFHPVAYRNNLEGLLVHEFNSTSILYKYPIKLGEIFDTSSTFFGTLASIDEIIFVPAGNFSCYNYQKVYQKIKVNNYISPGIGIIKADIAIGLDAAQPYVKETWELISYNIK